MLSIARLLFLSRKYTLTLERPWIFGVIQKNGILGGKDLFYQSALFWHITEVALMEGYISSKIWGLCGFCGKVPSCQNKFGSRDA